MQRYIIIQIETLHLNTIFLGTLIIMNLNKNDEIFHHSPDYRKDLRFALFVPKFYTYNYNVH